MADPQGRRCSICAETKPISDFTPKNYRCRPCGAAYARVFRKNNPENVRKAQQKANAKRPPQTGIEKQGYHLKNRYGLTVQNRQNMIDAQNNRCAICKDVFVKTPHVDHCHATGVVRGLLCTHCNRGLGAFRDNEAFMYAAILYLKSVKNG